MAENVKIVYKEELDPLLGSLSSALIIVDDSSKIVSFTPAAAALFGLSDKELRGNFWAGLDAQLTLIMWRHRWQELAKAGLISYKTDIATSSNYLRPVSVTISLIGENFAVVEITDLIDKQSAAFQLQSISKATGTGYFHYNRIDKSFVVSATARELLGLPDIEDRKEAIDHLQKVMAESEWHRLRDLATEILETPQTFASTLRLENSNGSTYLKVEGQSFGNSLHVTHLVSSISLLNEQPQAPSGFESTITGELARFSLEEARDMIFWTRPDGSFHFVNQSAAQRLGYSKTELQGNNVKVIAPYFDESYREAFWTQLREEKSLSAEYDVFHHDGSRIPISAVVNYLRFGEEEYACSFCRDLSLKKKRDTIIELSQAALDFASDHILWLEKDYTVRYLNSTMLELLGGKDEDWEGEHYRKLFPDLPQERLTPKTNIEYSLLDRAGRAHHLDLRCDLLTYQDTQYLAIVGRDVSERHKKQKKLEAALDQIKELRDRLEHENVTLKEDLNKANNVDEIITVSPKYRKVLQKISQVADVNTTVLITGETGTGKELLARAIHRMSERNENPLVKVNCAALPESLIESELFGHEKGAFTGAISRKKGRFELADSGTLFLDEVGEMPLDLQAKLLRVLQENEFERLGGTETIRVDVRLIAATNRNLEKMVAAGRFRADLFYRLNVFPIHNLALRKRPEDIPVLIKYFAKKFAKKQGKKITEIDAVDLEQLSSYEFPGNIRELENIVERAVVICNSEVLSIPLEKRKKKVAEEEGFLTFEEVQRKHIIKALRRTSGRITGPNGAGQLLDMNDRTLMSKMRKLNIHKREYLL